jgi:O-Antigen ligase
MLSKILLPSIGISLGIFILLATTLSLKWLILAFSALATLVFLIMAPEKKKLFLTLLIIDTDLLIDINLFNDPDVLASVDGLQISITTITLCLLYVLWWVEIITKREKRVRFFPKVTLIASGYIASNLLSLYNSPNIFMSIFSVFSLIQMLMVCFYIANYIENERDIAYIAHVLLVCLFIQSATVLIQYFTRTDFGFTGEISSIDEFQYFHGGRVMDAYRPAGTGNSSTDAGGHIAMLLLMMVSLLLYTKNRFKNTLLWVIWLLGLAALILTFSRGAWGGLTVGLVIFLIVALRHRWISRKKVVAMAVLVCVILGVFAVPIGARLSQDDQGSAWARFPLMKLAFNMIQQHPFIGVGANNFGIVLPQYLSSEIRGEWLYIVHNQYLLVFSETGIVGLFFFLLIIATVVNTCVCCIKYNDPLISPLSLGMMSGIVAYLLFMMIELSVSRLNVQLFWIMVAIAVASERLVRVNRQKRPNRLTPIKVESQLPLLA